MLVRTTQGRTPAGGSRSIVVGSSMGHSSAPAALTMLAASVVRVATSRSWLCAWPIVRAARSTSPRSACWRISLAYARKLSTTAVETMASSSRPSTWSSSAWSARAPMVALSSPDISTEAAITAASDSGGRFCRTVIAAITAETPAASTTRTMATAVTHSDGVHRSVTTPYRKYARPISSVYRDRLKKVLSTGCCRT